MSRRALVGFVSTVVLASGPASGRSGPDDAHRPSRWIIEGSFAWAWTLGNDAWIGSEIRQNVTLDQAALRVDSERALTPLQTTMGSGGQPLVRVRYDWENWGISGEVWRLQTEGELSGSAFGEDLRIDLWERLRPTAYDVLYDAKDELSSWTGRLRTQPSPEPVSISRRGSRGAEG